ncbi:hypothetical protein F2Q69_00056124 [Brassica cretica]|uniref:Malectin-like domain-containing protein n=1 Tax=Brassica cretica TaxID=69181 RepID=A0A8S9MXF9_BRACR|nr:hypothetical protein F2Q69_00056124 [Brassica cretica]
MALSELWLSQILACVFIHCCIWPSRTLSRNKINGTIPVSLTGLPNLINLLLDSNNLNSQIPQTLFQIPKYNFTGNNLNCGVGQLHPCVSEVARSGDSSKPKTGIIPGVVAGVTVVLFGILVFLFCRDTHKGYKRDVFVDVAGWFVDVAAVPPQTGLTRVEITDYNPSWLPRIGRRAAPTSLARVGLPASPTPSRDVATSSSSCVRVRLPASLDPELRHRRFLLFVCAGSRSCELSTRVVELYLLRHGQPRVLHLHRNTRHRRHQQVAAVVRIATVASDRAVTACPEAPECFSLSQSSLTVETPHRKPLMYRSSPPRRDRISRPWYPPPPSCSSSARKFFSRRNILLIPPLSFQSCRPDPQYLQNGPSPLYSSQFGP